jgi:hypothetical protein
MTHLRDINASLKWTESALQISRAHLCSMKVTLERTRRAVDSSRKLLEPAKPAVLKEVQVEDDLDARLRATARVMEILSGAGFDCEFHPYGVTLQ